MTVFLKRDGVLLWVLGQISVDTHGRAYLSHPSNANPKSPDTQ